MLFYREPTLVLGVVRAICVVAAAFGLNLTEEQTIAVYALCEAVLSLVNRQLVRPVP